MLTNIKSIIFFTFFLYPSLLIGIPFHRDETRQTIESQFYWQTIASPFTDKVARAVMFDSANGYIMSLSNHQLYRLQNGNWQIYPTPERYQNYLLLGISPDNIWISCLDKVTYRYILRHFDGKNWQDIYTPNADPIRDLDYLAPDNIWGACEWGEIIHFNGKEWQLVPTPFFAHFNCIVMTGDSSGWIGGEYRGKGILLRKSGKNWSIFKHKNLNEITKIIMVNSSVGWAFLALSDSILRLGKDHYTFFNLNTTLQDTASITLSYHNNPIFMHQKQTSIQSNNLAYISMDDGKREILFTKSTGDQLNYYIMSSDGSIKKFLRCQQNEIVTSSFHTTWKTKYQNEYGVAFGDLDNDGDDDIYIINTYDGNRLMLFGGNSQINSANPDYFIDAADQINLLGATRTENGECVFDMGATLADIDNDGDRDVYITSLYDKNMLYENISGKTFHEIAKRAGIDLGEARSNVGIWGDVDNDGDVDLFVTNENTTNMLFLNNGAGKFQNITAIAGLTSIRNGKGATFGDIDLDGDSDLVVPYFSLRNRIYRNEGIHQKTGQVYFTDVTDQSLPPDSDSLAKSTSCCLADIDNDGDLDLYITNLVFSNRLYENDGSGHFKDITKAAGVKDSSLSNSACFFDVDNDGNLDLFVTNRGRNLFFKNIGNGNFVRDNKIFKIDQAEHSTGIACGDPDNDGDIDCYVANDDQTSFYCINNLNNKNYLSIKLVGTTSNRDAIGAKVFLYESGHLNHNKHLLAMREINGGYGYGCMNSTSVHFGVQSDKKYDVKIWFPSGIEVLKYNLIPGQLITIEEQTGWSRFIAVNKRAFLRILKTPANQIELFKFIGLIIILMIIRFLLLQRGWVENAYRGHFVITPLSFYIFVSLFTLNRGFFISHFFPTMISLLSFAMIIAHYREKTTKINRERLAEELLTSIKAFEHGTWATSYLNQLQLFSANLQANQPIPEKSGQKLKETITEFYNLVYKEIMHIHQLALDAQIQVNQALELKRQLLFLSENLEKIKVAIALKKGVASEIWQNVPRLTDQVKMNLREINFGATKFFSCNASEVVQQTIKNFQRQDAIPISFPVDRQNGADFQVCIKASELTAIIENLIQNAKSAVQNQPDPQIKLSFQQTDQYLSLEFQDNGCGIPKKLWEKIFEQNFSSKDNGNGGYGLYYSRLKLEKYGGSIEILKSIKNRGTTFLVKLKRV